MVYLFTLSHPDARSNCGHFRCIGTSLKKFHSRFTQKLLLMGFKLWCIGIGVVDHGGKFKYDTTVVGLESENALIFAYPKLQNWQARTLYPALRNKD
jgi:hypothetical protein